MLDKKLYKESYENILIYDKTSTSAKPLCIMFDEIDGFIKIHDGIRYLVLFDYEWCDKICDRIKYLTLKRLQFDPTSGFFENCIF